MTKTFNHTSPYGHGMDFEGRARTEGPAKDAPPASTETSSRHAPAGHKHVRHGHLRIHRLPPLSGMIDNKSGSRSRRLKPHLRAIAESFGMDARTLRKKLFSMERNARKTRPAKSHAGKADSKTTRFDYARRALHNISRALLGAKHTSSAAS